MQFGRASASFCASSSGVHRTLRWACHGTTRSRQHHQLSFSQLNAAVSTNLTQLGEKDLVSNCKKKSAILLPGDAATSISLVICPCPSMTDPPTSKLDQKQHEVGPTRSSSLWSCVAQTQLNRIYFNNQQKHEKHQNLLNGFMLKSRHLPSRQRLPP